MGSDQAARKETTMKVIKGHLTQSEKKAINAIINQGWLNKTAKVGRKTYQVVKVENYFSVLITENKSNDFGVMVASSYKAEFSI